MHWESQSGTTQAGTAGQNLINHANLTNGPLTSPFQFLGRGKQVSYSGERRIAMVWQLDHPMPAELLEANRVGG